MWWLTFIRDKKNGITQNRMWHLENLLLLNFFVIFFGKKKRKKNGVRTQYPHQACLKLYFCSRGVLSWCYMITLTAQWKVEIIMFCFVLFFFFNRKVAIFFCRADFGFIWGLVALLLPSAHTCIYDARWIMYNNNSTNETICKLSPVVIVVPLQCVQRSMYVSECTF